MATRRDMTEAQFKARAHANGFRLCMLGLETVGAPHTSIYGYSMVKKGGQWKVDRRHSLARAIQARDAYEAKQSAKAKAGVA